MSLQLWFVSVAGLWGRLSQATRGSGPSYTSGLSVSSGILVLLDEVGESMVNGSLSICA